MNLSRVYLESATEQERQLYLKQLGAALTVRVLKAIDFDTEVETIIGELRKLRHDLWLYDSDGEWQLWCGDYTKPETSGKLILHFDPTEGAEASWSET